jgi:ankyrin repeat protein
MLDQFKDGKSKVALHFAVARGDLDIVKYMIENLKLDILVKDSEGNNPFFTAVEHGHLDIVKYFIEESNFTANCTK